MLWKMPIWNGLGRGPPMSRLSIDHSRLMAHQPLRSISDQWPVPMTFNQGRRQIRVVLHYWVLLYLLYLHNPVCITWRCIALNNAHVMQTESQYCCNQLFHQKWPFSPFRSGVHHIPVLHLPSVWISKLMMGLHAMYGLLTPFVLANLALKISYQATPSPSFWNMIKQRGYLWNVAYYCELNN